MSLHIEFTPHSWYMGWAIKREQLDTGEAIGKRGHSLAGTRKRSSLWSAYTANGMTGYVEETHADTLKELKQQIREHRQRQEERTREIYRRLEEDR